MKSSLLTVIAEKMTNVKNEKAAYLKAAKTLFNDNNFHWALRALE